MKQPILLFGLLAGFAAAARAQENFDGCGVLVRGVECVLFETDAHERFILQERDGFQVGDRVHVVGEIDRGCFSFCLQGDGCIVGNTIELCCEPCDTNCDGSINQFDIQPFVDALLEHSGCSPCAADANGDGSLNQFDIQGFVDCLAGP